MVLRTELDEITKGRDQLARKQEFKMWQTCESCVYNQIPCQNTMHKIVKSACAILIPIEHSHVQCSSEKEWKDKEECITFTVHVVCCQKTEVTSHSMRVSICKESVHQLVYQSVKNFTIYTVHNIIMQEAFRVTLKALLGLAILRFFLMKMYEISMKNSNFMGWCT